MAKARDIRFQSAASEVRRRATLRRNVFLPRSLRARKYLPYVVIIVAIFVVYRWWLTSGVVTGGDWGYGADAHLREFFPIPSLWDVDAADGTGAANIFAGPAFPLYFLHGLLAHLGIGYAVSERLIWLFPCLLAGSFATYAFAVEVFSSRLAGVVSASFVAFNYYTMAIFAGGQFTVIDAGLLMPLALWLFYRALLRPTASRLAPLALAIGVQVMYDPRSTYLTVWVLFLLSLYCVITQPSIAAALRAVLRVTLQFAVIGVGVISMHLFWLLPGRYAEKLVLPGNYNSVGWVGALSYFHFDNGFSLYQPPPPNTLVGALFLLLPVMAFGTLLRRQVTSVDLFLVSVALLFIFFTKGDNPPAGNIYDWMFVHIPGFNIYRDPSKFFQPVLLADALLLGRMVTVLNGQLSMMWSAARTLTRVAAPLLCFIPVAVSAAPIASRGSYATFAPVTVPGEYLALQRYMEQQRHFSRTLWVFGQALYDGSTALHPAIGADTVDQQLQPFAQVRDSSPSWMLLPRAREILQALSVEYVAVGDNQNPGDSARMTARNRAMQAQRIGLVRRSFLRFAEIRIGNIHLFRNPTYLPALFISRAALSNTQVRALLERATVPSNAGVRRAGTPGEFPTACRACLVDAPSSYGQGQTRFEAVVHRATHPFLLVLNQAFDPNWSVYIEPVGAALPFWWPWTHPAVPHRYHTTVNGFANAWWIDMPGTYRIIVEYWPQRLVDVGFVLCWLTILACLSITIAPSALAWVRRQDRSYPQNPTR